MIRIKLGLLTLLALFASSVTLAAVAQSASTAQTVRVSEVSYGIRFSAKPKAGTVKFQVRNASGDDDDRNDNSGHGPRHGGHDDNSGHGSGHDSNDD